MKAISNAAGMVMGLTACAVVDAATKQESYPARPIRFVVPFAPGGPSDILSRLVGLKLGEAVGATVVIDNRGAVGGIVGAELAANAPPDGYTLLLAANSLLTINPHVYKKLGYSPERDLQPITQLTSTGNVVVIHPSVAATSLKEFIALAKAKPGQINYATTGTGNVLGVTSLDRNPALPDVPTVTESGLPGFKNITWHSVLVPARTPKELVKRLNTELVKIVNMPDVKERFTAQGLTQVGSTPEQVVALMREESQEHAKLVKQIGLQPQ